MGKREEQKGRTWQSTLKTVLIGAIIAIFVSAIILFFCSIAVANGLLSEKNLVHYTLFACTLGSFVGGVFAVGRIRSKKLFIGLGTGALAFLVILLIGLTSYKEISFFEKGIRILVACMIGGAAAGLLGGRKRKKGKR